MKPKRIRVHENFKNLLEKTLEEMNKYSEQKLSMVDLTEIIAGNNNSNGKGLLSLKMPIIIIPAQKSRGRPKKPIFERYVNIVLEDEPR